MFGQDFAHQILSVFITIFAFSHFRACRVTTQKLLYFLVFLACVLRGAYFAAPVSWICWITWIKCSLMIPLKIHKKYRMILVVVDLCWVDFDFKVA